MTSPTIRTSRALKPLLATMALVSLSSCLPARAQTVRVEAETHPTAGDLKILDLPDASGGKAVSIARDWQPLIKASVPQGEAFNVWVRWKDGSILAKKTPGGEQKDLKWVYGKPTELTWKNLGRFQREELGDTLLVIRGGGGGQGPVLDCVLFASDENFDPAKDDGAPGTPVTNVAPLPADKETDTGDANINEGAQLALGMIKAPQGVFVEAEANKPGGTNEIVEVAGASGGKAVTTDRDYQNLFQAPLPGGDAWRIFVRHKGGPFALKTQADGKASDRWFFRKPSGWTWTETDVFSREDLGGKELRIGRGTTGEVFIDAVVFSPEAKRPLPFDKPDPNAPAQKISASVDWNKIVGTVPILAWGINEHEVNTPKSASDPKYQQLLGALDSPFIRVHQGGLVNKWTSAKTRDWDVDKIKAGFAASSGFNHAKLMITFDEWPAWLSKSSTLEPEKVDEFAALCARLVKIMRDEVKVPVAYWEITNERDNNYEKAGKLPELYSLYATVAKAIRKEEPRAKIGGLAFTWGNPKWVGGFLATQPDIDFLSWHNYGTGDLYESNESLFAKANTNVGGIARGVLDEIKKNPPAKPIETFLTETNVKYTWDPYERRHQNVVGSIFQALVVQKISLLGVSGANLWQERGAAYGSLVDNKNVTFPSYTLYGWGPKHLRGKVAGVISGDEKSLGVLPVINARGEKAVLLWNQTRGDITIPGAGRWIAGAQIERITADGTVGAQKVAGADVILPGYSMALRRIGN